MISKKRKKYLLLKRANINVVTKDVTKNTQRMIIRVMRLVHIIQGILSFMI